MLLLDKLNNSNQELRLFYLSFLIAISVTLSLAEYLIPFKPPFMKLGLANAIPLILIISSKYKYAIIVALFKVIISALITGSIASIGSLLSFSGTFASITIMIFLFIILMKKINFVGLSLIGAIAHISGQLLVAYLTGILPSFNSLITLYPILFTLSIVSGLITGLLGNYLYKNL